MESVFKYFFLNLHENEIIFSYFFIISNLLSLHGLFCYLWQLNYLKYNGVGYFLFFVNLIIVLLPLS